MKYLLNYLADKIKQVLTKNSWYLIFVDYCVYGEFIQQIYPINNLI